MSPLSGNESDFLLHTRGIHGFLQFPKRLNRLLKRTRLHLGSKNNLVMKANLLIEKKSGIFFSFYSQTESISSEDSLEFFLDDDMDYDLVTKLFVLT